MTWLSDGINGFATPLQRKIHLATGRIQSTVFANGLAISEMSKASADITNGTGMDTRYVKDSAEIMQIMKLLRDQCASLTLRVDGEADVYSCRLLDVDNRQFVIDDISPRLGLSAIKNAKSFSISARSPGNFLFIEDNRVVLSSEIRGIPHFLVTLPKQVLAAQRRHEPRYQLPISVTAAGAELSLCNDAEPPVYMQGEVRALSIGGCQAHFRLPTQLTLETDQLFRSSLQIGDVLQIRPQLAVRRLEKDLRNNSLTCTFEFVGLDLSDRRQLDKFVRALAHG